jgi:hypothetical protein
LPDCRLSSLPEQARIGIRLHDRTTVPVFVSTTLFAFVDTTMPVHPYTPAISCSNASTENRFIAEWRFCIFIPLPFCFAVFILFYLLNPLRISLFTFVILHIIADAVIQIFPQSKI